jgi:hypothetical protein
MIAMRAFMSGAPVTSSGTGVEMVLAVGARLGVAVPAAAVLGGLAFTLAIFVGGARLERAVHRRLHPHVDGGAEPPGMRAPPRRGLVRRRTRRR